MFRTVKTGLLYLFHNHVCSSRNSPIMLVQLSKKEHSIRSSTHARRIISECEVPLETRMETGRLAVWSEHYRKITGFTLPCICFSSQPCGSWPGSTARWASRRMLQRILPAFAWVPRVPGGLLTYLLADSCYESEYLIILCAV